MSARVIGRRAVPAAMSRAVPPKGDVVFMGALFRAWREKFEHGVLPDPAETCAAAEEVLLAHETAEDRQIPLDPSNPEDAWKLVHGQFVRESAAEMASTMGPAAQAVYAHLRTAMAEHMPSVQARLRSPSPNLLIVVRAPSHHWYDPVNEAVCAWIWMRDAEMGTSRREIAMAKPETGYSRKEKRVIKPREVLDPLRRRHVVCLTSTEDVPDVVQTVADAVIDLAGAIGADELAPVVEAKFGVRPDWPDDLRAHRFRPEMLEAALLRATSADGVHHLLETLACAESVEEAEQIRKKADDIAAEAAKAKSADGAVTRPVSPALADLAGYGDVRTWGEALAADLADYRAKRIGWEDVDAGCLLHGPPGTGKTLFASALAATCQMPFIATSFAQWQGPKGGHLGDVVQELQKTFKLANENAPCIMFIDEIDAIPARGSSKYHDDYWQPIVTALLEALDGTSRREGVVVVAACNHPGRLDPALVRSGRLDRRFAIELPDEEALAGILGHHLPGIDAAVIEPVATTLAGTTSGADAARIAREARRIARRSGRPLTGDDLLAVAMPADTRPLAIRRRLAVHEAGHAVALMCQGRLPISLSLVGAGASGGRVVADHGLAGTPLLGDVEAEVVVSLAGRAAEEVLLGQPSVGAGGETGGGSDLERATKLLAASQSVLGLGGYLIHGLGADGAVVEERLRRLYAETLLLLGRHRLVVDALATLALEKRVLGRKALREFAAEHVPGVFP